MAVNYVKFFRGSTEAFENVIKNSDTLYFISDSDSNKSSLYLGEKLVANSATELADLDDSLLSELSNGQLLVYDEDNQKWVNKDIIDAIGIMVGATSTSQGDIGLVPAPGIGQDQLFLRGDGTWAAPSATPDLSTDNVTINLLDDGATLSLKDYGKQFYKYVAATGSEETGDYVAAHYKLQIVDADNPWAAGLEPKVVNEDGELVLGWFEPNQTTFEGIVDGLSALQNEVTEAKKAINDNSTTIAGVKTDIATITGNLSGKANTSDVYTKTETDTKINEAIISLDHLTRKTFNSMSEAENFISSVVDPTNYVYMILSASGSVNNTYSEYLYVEGQGLELVGSWEVNLDDYVTDVELATALMGKVDTKANHSLMSDEEKTKLAGIEDNAEKNLFNQVNTDNFSIDTTVDGKTQLNLHTVGVNQVSNLQNLLDSKAEDADLSSLTTTVNSLDTTLTNLDTRVVDLEKVLNNPANYITRQEYDDDMSVVMNSITWNDLDTPTV